MRMGSGGGAELVDFGNQAQGDERQDRRMRLGEAGQYSFGQASSGTPAMGFSIRLPFKRALVPKWFKA